MKNKFKSVTNAGLETSFSHINFHEIKTILNIDKFILWGMSFIIVTMPNILRSAKAGLRLAGGYKLCNSALNFILVWILCFFNMKFLAKNFANYLCAAVDARQY